jgi:hypothetical protein
MGLLCKIIRRFNPQNRSISKYYFVFSNGFRPELKRENLNARHEWIMPLFLPNICHAVEICLQRGRQVRTCIVYPEVHTRVLWRYMLMYPEGTCPCTLEVHTRVLRKYILVWGNRTKREISVYN